MRQVKRDHYSLKNIFNKKDFWIDFNFLLQAFGRAIKNKQKIIKITTLPKYLNLKKQLRKIKNRI